jgi:hypothetical protein
MSATPSYPSIYIEGIPSGARAIAGMATSMSDSAPLDRLSNHGRIRCEARGQACFHML